MLLKTDFRFSIFAISPFQQIECLMTKWFYFCFIHDNFLKAAECDWFLGLRTHIVCGLLLKNVLHENVLLNKEA
jgi:hypothetical protein